MTLSLFERCQSGLVSSLCCLSLRRAFSQWKIENGKLKMENGKWNIETGGV